MIKVTGLHKYFFRHKRNEIHVLNDMSLEFPESGLVVLLGPSGSGKTTLLNVIGGLDSVQQGTIQFDETLIKGYPSSTWDKIRNEKIGYIFQNYNLLPQLSVYDNIALVLKMMGINHPEVIEDRVNYMLHAVNMYPYRKKKATQLSGGQQQRVAIARALVKNPEVIIADEPTGNLDSKNTMDIMNIIKEISKQKLVVLVTHERDIANIYGDRIIEIKDGKIVNDYENDATHEHEVSDENVIYLKDLNQLSVLKDDLIELSAYQDQKQPMEPLKIRLIVKNKTLYLDVDSSIQKVKLLDTSSNLKIKDEHYVKKNKEQMLETTFKTEALDNTDVIRSYRTVVSIKSIFMLALQKILYSSKKGKLMLFSFIMAGSVLALAVAMLAATVIPDYDQQFLGENYLRVNVNISNRLSYEALKTYSEDDPELYVNTLGAINVHIIDPVNPMQNMISFGGAFDLVDHAPRRLTYGRMPTSDDEILITKKIADDIIERNGPDYGIWNKQQLLLEKFRIENMEEIKVVGIVDSGKMIVYGTRALANHVVTRTVMLQGFNINIIYQGDLYLTNTQVVHGTRPTGNAVVVSSMLFEQISGTEADTVTTWPVEVPNFNYTISGVKEEDAYKIYAADELMEKIRLSLSNEYYVYTIRSLKMAESLKADGINAVDLKENLRTQFNEAMIEPRVTMSIVFFVVSGLSLLGFYFIMHSSMVSRIYDISVYRALGMKKSEIFISFLVEVLIISTVTSVVGFLISSYAVSQAENTLIGMFRIFIVSPVSLLLGLIIVYAINLVGGLFPIFLLLRKTPAQILAQYDI